MSAVVVQLGARAERCLLHLAEMLPQLVFLSDDRGACLYVNSRWKDQTGLGVAATAHEGWLEAVHEEDRARCALAWLEAKRLRQTFEQDVRLGEAPPVWYLLRFEPVVDQGAVTWVATATNIDEQKCAALAARAQFDVAASMLHECLGVFVSRRDPGGRIVDFTIQYLNPAACRSAGKTLEEQRGRGFVALMPSHHETDLFDAAVSVVESGTAFFGERVVSVETSSGVRRERWFEIRAEKLHDGFVAAWRDITERKREEQELRRRAELLDALGHATLVWRLDDRVLTDWNDAATDLYGHGASDVVGRAKHEILEAELPPSSSWEDIERVLRERGRWAGEVVHKTRDGRRVRVESEMRVVPGARGAARVIETTRDVSLLRRDEERFRLALTAGRIGTWEWVIEGGGVFWSPESYEIMGSGAFGGNLDDFERLVHPDDRAALWARVDAALAGGPPYEHTFRIVRADGTTRWVRNHGIVVRRPTGAPERLVGTVEDVTEGVEAQRALEDRDAQLRAILDSTPTGLAIFDTEMRLVLASRAYVEMVGIDASAFGRIIYDVLPDIPERWREIHRRCLAGERVTLVEDVWSRSSGLSRRYNGVLTPWRASDGAVRGLILTTEDVTERHAAAEVLRQSEARLAEESRRKDVFLAILAHELRNPLAPIRYSAELLSELERSDPRLTRPREVLERQTRHMTRLVDELLDVSRIAQGKITLAPETLDLRALVTEGLSDFRGEVSAAKISMTASLPDAPVWVRGDPTRLRQTLSNLLRNACKFTDVGGSVEVVVEHEGPEHASLRVRDDGIGIEPHMLARIFEPFSQVEGTVARSRGGLGLGLALVRGLVELHGGRIEARSEGVGRGAELRVLLPTSAAPLPSSKMPAVPERGPSPRALRVVVVEDHDDGLEMLTAMIEMLGLSVVGSAREGEAAIALIEREQPDVVLCDIGLTGPLDGYAVAEAIRARASLAGMRLIALTGYGLESDRQRARDAGFDEHVVKPIDFAKLSSLFET